MDMGAQENKFTAFDASRLSQVFPNYPTMLSTRPASVIDNCTRRLRAKEDSYTCNLKLFERSSGMIGALYCLDKADELYMDIVELLKSNGHYRFIAVKWGNLVKKGFDAYQRNRDRFTNVDPVDFADIIEITDRMMSDKVSRMIEAESIRMADNGLTGYWNDVNSRLMVFFELISMAKTYRDKDKRIIESNSFGTFKLLDFMDYNRVLKITQEFLLHNARALHFCDPDDSTEDDIKHANDLFNALKDANNRSVITNIFRSIREGRFKDE